jgi:sulfate/thiosulfate transport system permease protein
MTANLQDARRKKEESRWAKNLLILGVVFYLILILFVPALNVFVQAFSGGIQGFLDTLGERSFLNAVRLTLLMALITVPLNTIFGLCAAWAIARHRFRGRALLISILDLPFSISPVVAGLMIVLLYGRNGWFGPLLNAADIKIIFAIPGMLLATAFVTLPFVAREVIPTLEEIGV